MKNAKRIFVNSKVRRGGVRPTRVDRPVPSSTPGTGGGPAGTPEHYVMNDLEPSQRDAFQAGMAMDSYPEPLNQHQEVNFRIADINPLGLGSAGTPILILTLAKGSAADKIRVDWEFTIPEQADVFALSILVNGMPFLNRLWQFPYDSSYPLEFFRKFDTASRVEFLLVQKPNTVLVPPLGNIRAWVIVDAYRGTYIG